MERSLLWRRLSEVFCECHECVACSTRTVESFAEGAKRLYGNTKVGYEFELNGKKFVVEGVE
jgi:hypothetical protein